MYIRIYIGLHRIIDQIDTYMKLDMQDYTDGTKSKFLSDMIIIGNEVETKCKIDQVQKQNSLLQGAGLWDLYLPLEDFFYDNAFCLGLL